MGRIGLILLATGSSSRMGSAKQLLPYRGRPLVRHATETALGSMATPVIVVVGARAEEIRAAMEGLTVEIVEYTRWEEGMGTSIEAGMRAASAWNLDGVILALADQPLVSAAILDRLITTHRETGKPIVASQYAGTVGVLAFFARVVSGAARAEA